MDCAESGMDGEVVGLLMVVGLPKNEFRFQLSSKKSIRMSVNYLWSLILLRCYTERGLGVFFR